MPDSPQVEPLNQSHRRGFFIITVLAFLIVLPLVAFYAAGYRFHFDGDASTPNIITTGGMYISVLDDAATIYLDEEPTSGSRLFRSATYIQNIDAGMHRVHVQLPGAYTWVKELPVDSQIVIEAGAFNMPEVPRVRPITEYQTELGAAVFFTAAAADEALSGATTTGDFVIATTTAQQRQVALSEEYEFIASLFAATTTDRRTLLERYQVAVERFGFSTTTATQVASTTIPEANDTILVERGGELYARYIGDPRRLPYYYCIVGYNASTTAAGYGAHVAESFLRQSLSTTTPLIEQEGRTCRQEIKLDRLRQDVKFYDFFPNDSDLVVLQLEDGLYVTEIDDRAWQNTQLLYPGSDFETIIENNAIYLSVGDVFFELSTEIEQN